MAKVYLFNVQAQPSGSPTPPLKMYVNGDKTSYPISFTAKSFDYVPFSTFGNRVPGNLPQGNSFVRNNSVVVEGVPPPLAYQLDLPVPPPETADLILYIFAQTLILVGTDGVLLRQYLPLTTSRHESRPPGAERETARLPDANGVVYVFNVFSETMSNFATNGGLAGTIPRWSSGQAGQPPIFTPDVLKVGRVLNPSEAPGHFVNGSNGAFFSWASGFFQLDLKIDGNLFPITQNLMLFILKDRWLLADQFGVQRGEGPVKTG